MAIREVSLKIEDVDIENDRCYVVVDSMGYPISLSRFLELVGSRSGFDPEQLFRNVAVSVAMEGIEVSMANMPAVIAFVESKKYRVVE